jgi:uncharacterized lipoprotein
VRGNLPGILAGLLVAGILQGCSISPAQQEEIRKAWEERDAERAPLPHVPYGHRVTRASREYDEGL